MGPLLRRDDEIDVTTPEPIQRMIGATGINTHLPQPVAPSHSGCLLLEQAHCLPALKARIADRYRRIFRLLSPPETRQRQRTSVRAADPGVP